MASDVRIGVRTDTGTSDAQINSLRGKLTALGGQAKGSLLMGAGLGAGVAGFNLLSTGVESATRFIVGSISAASDFNETVSKTGQILGQDALPGLQEWAKGAADAFGQSEQQALDAASTFAIFGKSAGKSGQDLVDFSTQLTELSGDFASFFNTSPEDAITAIGAALRGESEPIRKYGILLNEATLKQRALSLGITKTTTEALTPQQKVLAAQAEIFAQSKDAQGDFARTQDGLANSTRQLEAKMANLSKAIGEHLLPLIVGLAGALNGLFDLMDARVPRSIADTNTAITAIGHWGAVLDNTATTMTVNWANAWAKMPKIVTTAGGRLGTVAEEVADDTVDKVVNRFGMLPKQASDAMLREQFHFNDAAAQLRETIENALSPKEERIRLIGFLNSKLVAEGLESGIPRVRRATELAVNETLRKLGRLGPAGEAAGIAFMTRLYNGISSQQWLVTQKAKDIAAAIAGEFPGSEPKDPQSPLRGLHEKGANIPRMLAEGMARGMGQAQRASLALAGAMAPGGGGSFAGAAMGGGMGGGITINLPPTTIPYSPAQYREAVQTLTPELVRELRRQGYAF